MLTAHPLSRALRPDCGPSANTPFPQDPGLLTWVPSSLSAGCCCHSVFLWRIPTLSVPATWNSHPGDSAGPLAPGMNGGATRPGLAGSGIGTPCSWEVEGQGLGETAAFCKVPVPGVTLTPVPMGMVCLAVNKGLKLPEVQGFLSEPRGHLSQRRGVGEEHWRN